MKKVKYISVKQCKFYLFTPFRHVLNICQIASMSNVLYLVLWEFLKKPAYYIILAVRDLCYLLDNTEMSHENRQGSELSKDISSFKYIPFIQQYIPNTCNVQALIWELGINWWTYPTTFPTSWYTEKSREDTDIKELIFLKWKIFSCE